MPRCNLTLKQKAQLIELSKELSTGQLAKKFRVHTTTVTRTIRKKDRILQQASRVNPNFKTVQTNQRSEEHDSMMLDYIKTQQEANRPISVSDICDKAVEYAEALGREIKSQRAWWRRFRVRCNVIKSKIARSEDKPRVTRRRRAKEEEASTIAIDMTEEPNVVDSECVTAVGNGLTTTAGGVNPPADTKPGAASAAVTTVTSNGEEKMDLVVVEVVELLKDNVPEAEDLVEPESVTIGPDGSPVEAGKDVTEAGNSGPVVEVVVANGPVDNGSNKEADDTADQPTEAKKDLIVCSKLKAKGDRPSSPDAKITPRRATRKAASPTTTTTTTTTTPKKRAIKAKTTTATRASTRPTTKRTTDNSPVIPDKNFTFKIREPAAKGLARGSDGAPSDDT